MSPKNTKGKTVEKSQPVAEVKKTEPVAEVKQAQKGGKKVAKQPEPVVEAKQPEPVVEVKQPEPAVEVKQSQKGGNKTDKKVTKQAEPVVEAKKPEPVVEVKQAQKGGKKVTKQAEPVVEAKKPEPVVEVKQSQKGGNKTDKKVAKQAEPVVEAKAEPKIQVEAADEEEGEEQIGGKLRYFKLFYNDEFQGRYCGRKPKQAANKAFSSIIKDMKKKGNQKGGAVNVDINFSIRECTRNSKHKEYNYVGVREKLGEPVDVQIKNEDGSVKKITYSFHNKISKAPKA